MLTSKQTIDFYQNLVENNSISHQPKEGKLKVIFFNFILKLLSNIGKCDNYL